MPFARKSLSELIDRTATDIESRLPGTDARLRYSLLGILARAHSGAVHGLYGNLQWMARQIILDTSEREFLDRHANIYLKDGRKPAVTSSGSVTCTGTNGSVIPADRLLQRSDGIEYITDAEATITSGSATVAVTAKVGGKNGDALAGSTLSFVTPIAGVNGTATVDAGGIADGLDEENDIDLLIRLLERIQSPPQGGAAHDYVAWAKEIPGVTRAWSYPLEDGPGTVKVRFMMDDKYSDGIPLVADVTTVHDHIDTLRPVGLAIGGYTTDAPVPAPLNFAMSITPNTQAVKDAITAELKDLIRRDSEPGGAILITRINEAISLAEGETDHILTAPTANVQPLASEIVTMGTVTFS